MTSRSTVTSRRTALTSRRTVVLTALLGAALLMISTTMTWIAATGLGETSSVAEVEVPGSQAADTVAAMGLVGLAGAVAVTIAGRAGRWIIAALLLIASLMSLYASLGVLIDPAGAAESAVGEVTGTTTSAQDYQLGLGAWTATLGAALMLAASLVLGAVSHRWADRKASTKYSRTAADEAAEPDEYDLLDGLSEGDDPTEAR